MESKHKQKKVRGLLKDFAVYTKRYFPASTELVRRFKKNGDTRGLRKHVEAIVHTTHAAAGHEVHGGQGQEGGQGILPHVQGC